MRSEGILEQILCVWLSKRSCSSIRFHHRKQFVISKSFQALWVGGATPECGRPHVFPNFIESIDSTSKLKEFYNSKIQEIKKNLKATGEVRGKTVWHLKSTKRAIDGKDLEFGVYGRGKVYGFVEV